MSQSPETSSWHASNSLSVSDNSDFRSEASQNAFSSMICVSELEAQDKKLEPHQNIDYSLDDGGNNSNLFADISTNIEPNSNSDRPSAAEFTSVEVSDPSKQIILSLTAFEEHSNENINKPSKCEAKNDSEKVNLVVEGFSTKAVVVDLCSEDNLEVLSQNSQFSEQSPDSSKSEDTNEIDESICIVKAVSRQNKKNMRSLQHRESQHVILLTDVDSSVNKSIEESTNRFDRRKRRRETEVLILDDEVLSAPKEMGGAATDPDDRSQAASTVIRSFSCPICMEDVPRGTQVCILGCGHRLCFGCAGDFVALKVQEAQVRACP